MPCRFRAKGEKIEFDTDEGKKEYLLKPLKNKQLLEIVELGEKKEGIKAALIMAKYSLNADPKIINGTEKPFTDEEMEEMEAPFLLQIMKKTAKLNGLEDMFDFDAEIELYLEGEKHIIEKTTIVYIPGGMMHCPLYINRVGKPFLFNNMYFTAEYMAKKE